VTQNFFSSSLLTRSASRPMRDSTNTWRNTVASDFDEPRNLREPFITRDPLWTIVMVIPILRNFVTVLDNLNHPTFELS
jgi:hypothetical protein